MIDKAFLSSDLFLLTLTVGLYCLGCAVYRRLRVPLLHPVLLTFVAVIVFLSAAGIDYPRYKQATSALDFALEEHAGQRMLAAEILRADADKQRAVCV